jgi:hypothetical protein
MIDDPLADLAIHLEIARLPGGEPIDVAVVHAEGGRDQHRVVNLFVRGALLACPR